MRLPAMVLPLLGALLAAAPAALALSLRDPLEDSDPWIASCEARWEKDRVDELDYGPCFEEEGAASEASRSDLMSQRAEPPTTMFTKVDGTCEVYPRPLSDRDAMLGHGNPACRYEPSRHDLERFRRRPEDIAIVIPSNQKVERQTRLTDKPEDMYPLNHGMLTWHRYAKYHGYAFYSGMPLYAEVDCPGLEERHPAWTKPCMAMQLIKKHKYLIIVDRDTTVIKPRLRLEPLFDMAGLMNKSGKIMAVAEEWGSCKSGVRCPVSGDVNTGILLVRQSAAAEEALENWFYGPTRCQGVIEEQLPRPRGWPFHSAPCKGCTCIMKGVRKWSYDQVAFFASVANNASFRDKITIFRPGCPFNSPFADFIPHLVSGTPSFRAYDIYQREPVAVNLHVCNSKLMETPPGEGDPYERCTLCGAVPKRLLGAGRKGSWADSCGGNFSA